MFFLKVDEEGRVIADTRLDQLLEIFSALNDRGENQWENNEALWEKKAELYAMFPDTTPEEIQSADKATQVQADRRIGTLYLETARILRDLQGEIGGRLGGQKGYANVMVALLTHAETSAEAETHLFRNFDLVEQSTAEGGGGIVYRATAKPDSRFAGSHENFAIKIAKEEDVFSFEALGASHMEKSLGELGVPGLVPVLDGVVTPFFTYYAMPWYGGDTLAAFIALNEHNLTARIDVLRPLIEVVGWALLICSALHICHRDIKPSNIFFKIPGDRWSLALGDLGLGSIGALARATRGVGTHYYAPPEMDLNAEPSNENESETYDGLAADVYSFAATTVHLLCGQVYFARAGNGVLTPEIVNDLLRSVVPDEDVNMLARMVSDDRPTMLEVVEHPWLGQGPVSNPFRQGEPLHGYYIEVDEEYQALAWAYERAINDRLTRDAIRAMENDIAARDQTIIARDQTIANLEQQLQQAQAQVQAQVQVQAVNGVAAAAPPVDENARRDLCRLAYNGARLEDEATAALGANATIRANLGTYLDGHATVQRVAALIPQAAGMTQGQVIECLRQYGPAMPMPLNIMTADRVEDLVHNRKKGDLNAIVKSVAGNMGSITEVAADRVTEHHAVWFPNNDDDDDNDNNNNGGGDGDNDNDGGDGNNAVAVIGGLLHAAEI